MPDIEFNARFRILIFPGLLDTRPSISINDRVNQAHPHWVVADVDSNGLAGFINSSMRLEISAAKLSAQALPAP